MKYLLDTADISEIIKWKDYIVGVTTNPGLLKKAEITADELYLKLKKPIRERDEFNVFVQVHNRNDLIKVYDKSEIIYKVPLVYPDGYNFLRELKEDGYKVCGTMTYDIIQIHQALIFNADFCIVLHSKNENENFVEDAMSLKNKSDSNTKLIASSVRTKNDVKRFLKLGYEYTTINPDVFKKLFVNEQAQKDWNDLYD